MQTLEVLLKEHTLFHDLNPDDIRTITGCASNVRFKAGNFILREGDPANEFYVIRQGKVTLEVFIPGKGPTSFQTLSDGEVVGWSWLFPPYRWHYDARVLEATRALAFNGKCLREKCDRDYRLGYELMKRFAGIVTSRLQAARLQLLDLYAPETGEA